MNDFMRIVLSLSISGSILAVLLFIMKPFIKHRLTKRFQFILWIIVILRFLLPVSFGNSFTTRIFDLGESQVMQSVDNNQSIGVTATSGINTNEAINPAGNAQMNSSGNMDTDKVTQNLTNSTKNVVAGFNIKSILNFIWQNSFYIWMIGAMLYLILQVGAYALFRFRLDKDNLPATEQQDRILEEVWKGRYAVKLIRNRLITTPMLVGVKHPMIVIPDVEFSEEELRFILLHEISHMKNYDIEIKWLTMIAMAFHWFNPLTYLIKKEMNRACELACDEAVIKNFSNSQKQAYGETLISVVSESRHSFGVLQATMSEEKKSLKERLLAIMYHEPKPMYFTLVSVIILIGTTVLGLFLGTASHKSGSTPPPVYIGSETNQTKTAITGTYEWTYRGTHITADSDHPMNFNYLEDNTVYIPKNGQLVIGTQKINMDKKYDFTISELTVYKAGQVYGAADQGIQYRNGAAYLQAPGKAGEYIYTLHIEYPNKGDVYYGFKVKVDMPEYNLEEIAKNKTPYVGNNSKVIGIAGSLPSPDSSFWQQYVSLQTKEKPYGATFYYEPAQNTAYEGKWPIVNPDADFEARMEANALIAFCMIDNVENITLAFRNSKSTGELVKEDYNSTFTFHRVDFEEKYGNLTDLGNNPDKLKDILSGKRTALKGLELYVWRVSELTGNDNLYYTLLPGTNRNKTEKEIHDMNAATSDLNIIRSKLSEYSEDTSLSIYHDKAIDKETMDSISARLQGIFASGTISIGALE